MKKIKTIIKNSYFFKALIALIILLAVMVFILLKNKSDYSSNKSGSLKLGEKVASNDGLGKAEEVDFSVSSSSFFAVMIDNHLVARPQYGLDEAEIVYEAEVEGGITRYLALFRTDKNIKKIGPIRSARPYFIDWAKENAISFVHCGGSPAALEELSRSGAFDMNEFYQGAYFWRDKNRSAPHNVFISTDKAVAYLKSKKQILSGQVLSWNFIASTTNAGTNVKNESIKLPFKKDGFATTWKYNKQSKSYERFIADKPVLSGDGKKIITKNLILQYTSKKVVDDKLRLEIKNTGQEEAVYCILGECSTGYWSKDSKKAKTNYFYKNKMQVLFVPGKIWIEVLDKKSKASY